jgi:hypothetical protein
MASATKKMRTSPTHDPGLPVANFIAFPLYPSHPIYKQPPADLRVLLEKTKQLHDEMMVHMKKNMTEACWMPLKNTQAGIISDMTSYLDEFEQKDGEDMLVSYETNTMQCLQLYHNMLTLLSRTMNMQQVMCVLLCLPMDYELTASKMNDILRGDSLYKFLTLLQSPLLDGLHRLCTTMQPYSSSDWVVTPHNFLTKMLQTESKGKGPYLTSTLICFCASELHSEKVAKALEIGAREGTHLNLALTVENKYNPYSLQIIFGCPQALDEVKDITKKIKDSTESSLRLSIRDSFCDYDVLMRMTRIWMRLARNGHEDFVKQAMVCLVPTGIRHSIAQQYMESHVFLMAILDSLQLEFHASRSTDSIFCLLQLLADATWYCYEITHNFIAWMMDERLLVLSPVQVKFLENFCAHVLRNGKAETFPDASCWVYASATLPQMVADKLVRFAEDNHFLDLQGVIGTFHLSGCDIVSYIMDAFNKWAIILRRLKGYITLKQADCIKEQHWSFISEFISSFYKQQFIPPIAGDEKEKEKEKEHIVCDDFYQHKVFWNYLSAYSSTLYGFRPSSQVDLDCTFSTLEEIARRKPVGLNTDLVFRLVDRRDPETGNERLYLVENV